MCVRPGQALQVALLVAMRSAVLACQEKHDKVLMDSVDDAPEQLVVPYSFACNVEQMNLNDLYALDAKTVPPSELAFQQKPATTSVHSGSELHVKLDDQNDAHCAGGGGGGGGGGMGHVVL